MAPVNRVYVSMAKYVLRVPPARLIASGMTHPVVWPPADRPTDRPGAFDRSLMRFFCAVRYYIVVYVHRVNVLG